MPNGITNTLKICFLTFCCGAILGCSSEKPDSDESGLSVDSAARFAKLAMDCIPQEYPNKLSQLLRDDTDLQPPMDLHPAFYGCYDWHSSVHGHWLLVKALKIHPDLPGHEEILAQISASLSRENIAGEVAYMERESRSWERMYGWAWLLQLANELQSWDDPLGEQLANNLEPLVKAIRDRYLDFLPKQVYPVRTGVHPNTAFGMSFAFDYAEAIGDSELQDQIVSTSMQYYSDDKNCPLSWEPSGEDFLSPCFEEAALMSRVMSESKFRQWLAEFLPALSDLSFLTPVDVSDRSDPKIAHLDGLNLSRATNLFIIASEVEDESVAGKLRAKAEEHLAASLPSITSEHYVGSHWLGSFAMYALTRD